MQEHDIQSAAVPDKKDERDKIFASVAPFDWELGFDIELLLGFRKSCHKEEEFFGPRGRANWGVERYREIVGIVQARRIPPFIIPPKNQGSNFSCTGQAAAQYLAVLNFIETGKWVEISARDVYAFITLGYGKGASLRDAMQLCVDRGVSTEELVPSYLQFETDSGVRREPLSEAEMIVKPEETEAIRAIRTALQSKEYQLLTATYKERMEQVAWATLQGFGCFFGIIGENNGSWSNIWPDPPTSEGWAHALYSGKAGIRNGKKFIGPINSWGNGCGENGWQCLSERYFLTVVDKTSVIFNPRTLVDKSNPTMSTNSNVKILKDKNGSAVGIWMPATSPESLRSVALNFGIELPTKEQEDGSVVLDFDAFIQGEFELK
jgi:hypothetical protein